MAKSNDSRAHPRATTKLNVRVRIAGKSEFLPVGEILNISLGGVFVALDDPPSFGTELELQFSLPGSGELRCGGYVAWSTKTSPELGSGRTGMGVRISGVGVKEMRDIAAFVSRSFAS